MTITVGGPAKSKSPVDRWLIPLFIGFQPSFWWCRSTKPWTATWYPSVVKDGKSLNSMEVVMGENHLKIEVLMEFWWENHRTKWGMFPCLITGEYQVHTHLCKRSQCVWAIKTETPKIHGFGLSDVIILYTSTVSWLVRLAICPFICWQKSILFSGTKWKHQHHQPLVGDTILTYSDLKHTSHEHGRIMKLKWVSKSLSLKHARIFQP